MTHRQKLEIEHSEIREAISGVLDKEEKTDADRDELKKLTTRAANLEGELRAAIVAEPDATGIETRSDPEARELEGLIQRASVGEILDAVIEQRHVEGADREVQQYFKLNGNQVPLEMLETRAATEAPTDVGRNADMPVPAVFPNSSSAYCGVDIVSVPTGEKTYAVLETDTPASDYDEAAAVTETSGTFSSTVLSGRRIQASFLWSREDQSKFMGMEASLRQNLTDALSSGLDHFILNRASSGLLAFGTAPTTPTSVETFATYRAAVFGAVDGRYAGDTSGVRVLCGAHSYAHMGSVYRSNNADDSALDSLNRIASVRVGGNIAAPVSNIQQALICRATNLKHSVAPVWNSITLIPDEVTLAAKGQIKITGVMLANHAVIRSDGFIRRAFKLA